MRQQHHSLLLLWYFPKQVVGNTEGQGVWKRFVKGQSYERHRVVIGERSALVHIPILVAPYTEDNLLQLGRIRFPRVEIFADGAEGYVSRVRYWVAVDAS